MFLYDCLESLKMQAAPESKPVGKQPPKERPTGKGLVKVSVMNLLVIYAYLLWFSPGCALR